MTTPWVRIVIVNFNGGDHLARAVAGLASQTDPCFEAVIVDNASTDGSFQRLRLTDQRFRLISAGTNLGFAAGCNLGARGAATDWLAMLNPDAVPEQGWLAALKAATERHPRAAAFGSTQVSAAVPTLLDGAGDNYSIYGLAWRGGYGAPVPPILGDVSVFSPCAAAALYRRDAFESAGGFAESFFCYLEDVDLGFRLRLAGHQIMQIGAARVSHAGSAIAGRASAFTLHHSARNGVYLLLRCMPAPLLTLALPLHLLAQAWLMVRAPKWSRLAGLAAGFRALPRLLVQRRAIQNQRRVKTGIVAGWLAWHPGRVSRREVVACYEEGRPGARMSHSDPA